MKAFLQNSLISLVTIAIILLAGEAAIRFVVFDQSQRAQGARALWLGYTNAYLQWASEKLDGCVFGDTITAHPYLGFVHHSEQTCGVRPNNVGVLDPQDMPFARDPHYFTVVVVGGSVASQLVGAYRGEQRLEKILNERYVSPNRKPFRILSGAAGSWNVPNQLTILNLYGDAVDAVIAVDGYNEAKNASEHLPINFPDTLNYLYAARPRLLSWTPIALMLSQNVRRLALKAPVLQDSFLLYWAFQRSVAFVAGDRSLAAKERYRLLGHYFSFPADWSNTQKNAWNREKYKSYIKLLGGEAKSLGLLYAHFVQPIRWIDKPLTAEEKSYREWIDREKYAWMFADASTELQRAGYHTFSLTSLFKHEPETIYADHVHFKITGNESRGYALMSKAIAETIGRAWSLKTKD